MGYDTYWIVAERCCRGCYLYYASFKLFCAGKRNENVFSTKLDGFFFFPNDEYRKIERDQFGEELYCAKIPEVIPILENMAKNLKRNSYRFTPPLAYFKEMQKHCENLDLVVIHYQP